VVAVVDAVGRGQLLGRAQDQQRRGRVADLERGDGAEEPAELSLEDGAHAQPDLHPFPPAAVTGTADGVHDRPGRQQTRNDRQRDRPPHPDQRDEGERQQRADDRAEVVHRALEAVRAAIGGGRNAVGEQGVARRHPQAAGQPRPGPQHADLPDRRGGRDAGRQRRGGGVAADRDLTPADRVVGQGTAPSLARPARPSATPSMIPSAAAGACSVDVSRLGSSEVGISWPASESRLAVPMPATPGVSHCSRSVEGSVTAAVWPAVSPRARQFGGTLVHGTRRPDRRRRSVVGGRTPRTRTRDERTTEMNARKGLLVGALVAATGLALGWAGVAYAAETTGVIHTCAQHRQPPGRHGHLPSRQEGRQRRRLPDLRRWPERNGRPGRDPRQPAVHLHEPNDSWNVHLIESSPDNVHHLACDHVRGLRDRGVTPPSAGTRPAPSRVPAAPRPQRTVAAISPPRSP
jgi:hypothetical protein